MIQKNRIEIIFRIEKRGFTYSFPFTRRRFPIAHDVSVVQNHRIKNAPTVECLGAMTLRKHLPAFLVTDQVFIVGRQQMQHLACCPAAGTGIPRSAPVTVHQKFASAEPAGLQIGMDRTHRPAGFGKRQARPPNEILQGGGSVTAEIACRERCQCLVPGKFFTPGNPFVEQGERRLTIDPGRDRCK